MCVCACLLLFERWWEQLQYASQKLRRHEVATRAQGRVLLRALLKTMEAFQRAVSEAVLSFEDAEILEWKIDGQEMSWTIEKLLIQVSRLTGTDLPSLDSMRVARIQAVEKELTTIREVCSKKDPDVEHLGTKPSLSQVDAMALASIIKSLRVQESSCAFRRRLLHATRQTHAEVPYSMETFAYGSTPFYSWIQVCTVPRVWESMRQYRNSNLALQLDRASDNPVSSSLDIHAPCVVFGSSSGSLVFYTSLLLGVPCVGVEILPILHDIAHDLQQQYKLPGCSFLNSDMLNTTLVATKLVVLTSQCWDDELYAQVRAKLETELDPGALVIDYRTGLDQSRAFTVAAQVDKLAVSWNSEQALFIFERT